MLVGETGQGGNTGWKSQKEAADVLLQGVVSFPRHPPGIFILSHLKFDIRTNSTATLLCY